MQTTYLGYMARAEAWLALGRAMDHSRPHTYMAQEQASSWSDMAVYAKERFNMCIQNVIPHNLKSISK